ncbi:MAG: hypothetical protein QOI19_2354, partial [Thermoleophilaceae bacterium]|nr:hypothetical protein [Thermoleophilaceae bacterium]
MIGTNLARFRPSGRVGRVLSGAHAPLDERPIGGRAAAVTRPQRVHPRTL